MTQKELSYTEDAIGHETSIISIIEDNVKNLNDEILIQFMNNEITKHNEIKEGLLNLLEEKKDE